MTEPTASPTAAEIVVDVSTVLSRIDDGLDEISPTDDELFRACVDRLLVAGRLVASVDVEALVRLVDDFESLVEPEGWRGSFGFSLARDLIRSADAFDGYAGIDGLVEAIDEETPDEATIGVAATAAVLLRRIREIAADRPHPRDPDFVPEATVATPEETPRLPRAADVDAFADVERTDR